MFNKFKSKKEEARYEETYKGTTDELNEEDLDKIEGGIFLDSEIEKQKDTINEFKSRGELSEEELDKITTQVPPMPNFDDELEEGTYIAENGEIVREGRNK